MSVCRALRVLNVTVLVRLLTALDDDMDETTERMNFVMGRLGKILKTKSESIDCLTMRAHNANVESYRMFH